MLPITESLAAPFAPVPGQPWVTVTGLTGDAVQFSVASSASARNTTITLYGQTIPILQTNAVVPPMLTGFQMVGPGTVQFSFTNNSNAQFTVLSATDLTLPIAQWTVVGTATNLSAGVYQFTDPQATNPARYYRVRSP